MRVVFVYPDVIGRGSGWVGSYHHGLASISAKLKSLGYETDLIHVKSKIGKFEFFDMLKEKNPDILGFTATTNQFPLAVAFANWAKELLPNMKMVLGGIHVTLNAEHVASINLFDYLCIGEGEEPIAELCHALETAKQTREIRNIWTTQDGALHKNPLRPLIDLNSLPFPDKSLFEYEKLEYAKQGRGAFMASKGCPYSCNYCCNQALRTAYQCSSDEYVRFKKVAYLIEEIRRELENYPFVKKVYFEDDILPLRMKWFREFITAYIKEIARPFMCNLHPAMASSEVMDLLHEAGCEQVQMGIETGNEKLRTKLLRKVVTNKKMRKAFEASKKAGIKSFSFNMVGLPNETVSDMLETVKINAELLVDTFVCNIFYPYPGTELHRFSLEHGLITTKEIPSYGHDTIIRTGRITRLQILFIHKYFPLLVALYRSIYSLGPHWRGFFERVLDSILKARLAALCMYPLLIWAYTVLRSNRTTERVGRVLTEKLLMTKSEKMSPKI